MCEGRQEGLTTWLGSSVGIVDHHYEFGNSRVSCVAVGLGLLDLCMGCLQLLGLPQDHDVQEDKIFLLSLLMAEMGVHSVAYAFPRVRIITTAVDKRVNEEFHIIPGIGK